MSLLRCLLSVNALGRRPACNRNRLIAHSRRPISIAMHHGVREKLLIVAGGKIHSLVRAA